MASGAVAVIGQDPAALDLGLVEGTRFRPRDRGDLGLVGQGGKCDGPGHDQAQGGPQHDAGDSQALPPCLFGRAHHGAVIAQCLDRHRPDISIAGVREQDRCGTRSLPCLGARDAKASSGEVHALQRGSSVCSPPHKGGAHRVCGAAVRQLRLNTRLR
jgi:hypothetical protein